MDFCPARYSYAEIEVLRAPGGLRGAEVSRLLATILHRDRVIAGAAVHLEATRRHLSAAGVVDRHVGCDCGICEARRTLERAARVVRGEEEP